MCSEVIITHELICIVPIGLTWCNANWRSLLRRHTITCKKTLYWHSENEDTKNWQL